MRTILHAGMFGTACLLLFLTPTASAQTSCPEGRTATGQCVNASLATTMRQSAVIFSQPKLSYTEFPVLPPDDRQYRYPNQLIPDPLRPAPTGTRLPAPSP